MKAILSVILLFIAAFEMMPLHAKTIKQQGIAYLYNGKKKHTPLGGVYIKAITANNGDVSDDKTGAFSLVLNNLKMGSRIGSVSVIKQGMMVFNQMATITLWEKITKSNHEDVTYYKGLLLEYTKELLMIMRIDFLEEITGVHINCKAFEE